MEESKRVMLFHYEADNVVTPKVLFTTVMNFGMHKVLLVNSSRHNISDNEKLKVFGTIQEALNSRDEKGVLYKDYSKTYTKPEESIPGTAKYTGFLDKEYKYTWLKDFIHPEGNNLIIIGPDQYTMPIDMMDLSEGNHLVSMKIGKNSLWSIVAGGIIARDSYLQDLYGKYVE